MLQDSTEPFMPAPNVRLLYAVVKGRNMRGYTQALP
jgi:hypothetical protein